MSSPAASVAAILPVDMERKRPAFHNRTGMDVNAVRPTSPGTSPVQGEKGTRPLAAGQSNGAGTNGQTAGDIGNDLMLLVQRGDRAALNRLFALYNGRLFNFVFRILGDMESAEDIVQETWLSLYERRESYQSTYKFSTWLFTIGRRKALSELRRRGVRSMVRSLTTFDGDRETAESIDPPQRTFSDPEGSTDSAILSAMVERALAKLPAHQREVVILRDIEGFDNEEIAAVLQWNLKPGAVRKRVFDAREAFRRAMLSIGYKEEDIAG